MTPDLIRSVAQLRHYLHALRQERKSVGLVPTMGALHAAHGRLMETARAGCDVVVTSIFVNPLQFGPNEDYLRYPREFEKDLALCGEKGVDVVFAPDVPEMYPQPQLTVVDVTRVSDHLCGIYRPGHFRGVATVVLKLFNMVRPDRAYFGEKDYQQLCVIRRMVEDLNLEVTIVPVPIVREPDGLAMSSRNVYLDAGERRIATTLFRALMHARSMIEDGERDSSKVKAEAIRLLTDEPAIRVEYVEVVDEREAQPLTTINQPVRIAAAIWIGKTRLIDNVSAMPANPHRT